MLVDFQSFAGKKKSWTQEACCSLEKSNRGPVLVLSFSNENGKAYSLLNLKKVLLGKDQSINFRSRHANGTFKITGSSHINSMLIKISKNETDGLPVYDFRYGPEIFSDALCNDSYAKEMLVKSKSTAVFNRNSSFSRTFRTLDPKATTEVLKPVNVQQTNLPHIFTPPAVNLSQNVPPASTEERLPAVLAQTSESPVSKRPKLQSHGFANLGQTCYIAAVLQMLSFSPLSTRLIASKRWLSGKDPESLAVSLADLFYEKSQGKNISLLKVKEKVAKLAGMFGEYNQEVSEFKNRMRMSF
jgi:hypothetical protein